MTKVKIHGPLDTVSGWYDEELAELKLSDDTGSCTLEEDECDALLRVIECAADTENALNDLTEYLEEVQGLNQRRAFRMAEFINNHAQAIATCVYGTT